MSALKVRYPCECCSDEAGFDVEVSGAGDVAFVGLDDEPLLVMTADEFDHVAAYVAKLRRNDYCAACAADDVD